VPAQAAPARALGTASVGPLVASNAAAASVLAKSSGERVEVASATSELTRVFAKPEGGFEFESAVVPQRARQSSGSWADIDLSLGRGGDGLYRPGVSVADVRFSGGGSGPFVTLVRGGKSFSLSWPGGLPAPVISGESATYAEVLPGVDLVARATRTGFTHVLVVKTAQAAANPAVRRIRFDTGGDARVVALPGGGLRAEADGVVLASADSPSMWDSTGSAAGVSGSASRAAVAGTTGSESGDGSSAAGPGDAAATALVRPEVTVEGDLLLHPDAGLLDSDAATFPLFVDPPWSTAKSRWAYATNNNSNNTLTDVARVGKNPEGGVLYRSYFDFPLSGIMGKHIESAYVQMRVDHSYNCGSWTNWLFHSNGIASTPRTAWAPKLNSVIGSTNANAYASGGCRPDGGTVVNFQTSNILGLIQTHVTNRWTNVTMALCACSDAGGSNESTVERWKKYFPNDAKLVVDFDSYPQPPSGLQVSGVACGAGRTTIGTLTPTLSAVFPDADTSQALATQFEWLEIPASGTYNDSTPRKGAPAGMSVPANGRATTAALSGVQAGRSYAFRARGTDPAPYSLTSPWSGWCEFKPDTTVPPVSVVVTSLPPGPGRPGTFTIASTKSTVTKFRYGWSGATTEVAATGTTTRSATVTLTAPKYGTNILYVSAVDTTLNESYASTEFVVARPSPPVARWRLDSYPGVTQAQAVEDVQPSLGDGDGAGPLTANTPMSSGVVSWADGVRVVGAKTATFDGWSSYLTTAGPVVDTSKSYSVASWVKLSSLPTQNAAIAVQEGSCFYGFFFGVTLTNGVPRWNVSARNGDCVTNPVYTGLHSANPITAADVNRWQHVAFSYDQADRSLTLFVNGVQAGKVPYASAWNATGPLQLSRTSANVVGNFLNGSLADVQVLDRVLVGGDFTGQLASDPFSGGVDEPGLLHPVQVGSWDFSRSRSCYELGSDPLLCQAPEAGQFGRRLALTQGSFIGYGHRDDGLLLDYWHYTEDPSDPYYGMPTEEYGRSQKNIGDAGNPVWQDTPVLRTDDSFAVSVWARPENASGNRTVVSQAGDQQSAFQIKYSTGGAEWQFCVTGADNESAATDCAISPATETAGVWVQVAGVYDAGKSELRLYINGVRAASRTISYVPMASAKPMYVGRARWHGALVDQWWGGVDDLSVYQGVLTDVAVKQLFESQSAEL
jgi:hypothetical protein